jgi:hypothetical protein
MFLYFPLSSFLLLFANLLQNPQDSYIESDLKLMELVTSFLTPSAVPFSPYSTIQMFHELYKIAVKFVEKSNAQNKKKTKRVHDDIDSEGNNQRHPVGKSTTTDIRVCISKLLCLDHVGLLSHLILDVRHDYVFPSQGSKY